MLPDDPMRDGYPHRRTFQARFLDVMAEVMVTEYWDEDGTVERVAVLRPSPYSPYGDPVELRQIAP